MASSQNRSSNTLVIPQAKQALQQMKYEVAQELGIQIPQDGYYGFIASRDNGSIGGGITRRLVQMAEQQLSGNFGGSNFR
jgi:small acid-soluble spore protein A (major alpha-type SASP)